MCALYTNLLYYYYIIHTGNPTLLQYKKRNKNINNNVTEKGKKEGRKEKIPVTLLNQDMY